VIKEELAIDLAMTMIITEEEIKETLDKELYIKEQELSRRQQ
jgi:hypothetical protein